MPKNVVEPDGCRFHSNLLEYLSSLYKSEAALRGTNEFK
jgi:hypothetical protein